jgi:ribose 5-phosphate isomerase A
MTLSSQDRLKQQAAERAVEMVTSGMVVGLGTGSTVAFALTHLAEHMTTGRLQDIVGVPSSLQTEKRAQDLGIPLTTLDHHPVIDLTIDGADEVDGDLNLIKGGGGALLREKILAQASRINLIIVDQSKLSDRLGSRCPLPVEVLPFAKPVEKQFLSALGATVKTRRDSQNRLFRTDQNNLILDADFGPIADPYQLARQLDARAGIVGHGLFLDLASNVFVADENRVRVLTANTT